MTTGETEETSGGHEETREGNMKPPRSVTALSTIAVQAGQSLIVVSVLKSGSLVHLQLVQVCPGLCELGSDQQENQQLMEEQQQLLLKLQKHEGEVLSAVEKNRQKERGRDEGVMEKRQEAEGEEEVQSAMEASLSEGWSLLLQLLLRRQEVLKLAAEFYRRALEFSVSLDRFEGLQIKQDDELMDLQLTYDSMRKDLLGKSLQVLSSSSVLLQKLRQLQVTEALQRRGGVLQHENQDQESSQCSRGVVLRLEQLVEALQDRRRRADQTIRLQIQQEKEQQESREKSFHDWVLAIEEVQDQDLQSGSTSAESSDLESDSRPGELKSDSKPEETKDLQSGSVSDQTPQLRLDLKAESRLDAKPESGSEDTRNLVSGSRLKLKTVSISEAIKNLQSGFKLNLTAGSGSDPMLDKPEQTRDLQPGTTVDQMPQSKLKPKPESRLDVKPESISEEIKDLQAGIRSVQMPESRSNHSSDSKSEETKDPGPRLDQAPQARIELISESKSDVKPESRQDESRNFKPGPKPEETKNPQTGSSLEQKKLKPLSEVTKNLQSGFRFNLMAGSRPDPKSDKPQETRNLHPGSGLNLKEESRSELKTETRLDRSEEKKDLQPGSGLDQAPQLRIDLKTESKSNVKPESRQEKSKNLKPGPKPDDQTRSSLEQKPESRSKMKPESRLSISEETTGPQPEPRSDQMPGSRSDLESDSKAEETRDLQSGSRLDVKPESRSESTTVLQSQFRSDETIEVRFDFKSVVQIESRLDVKPECKSPQNLQSGLKLNLMPGSRSDKPEQTRDLQPGSSSEQKQGLKQTKDVAPESSLESKPGSKPGSRPDPGSDKSDETGHMKSGSRSDLKTESKSEIKPDSRSEKNKNFKPEVKLEQTKDLQPGSRSELKNQSRSDRSEETDPKSDSRSEETRDLQPELKTEPGLHLSQEKTRDLEPECRSDLRSESRSVESIELQFGFKSVVQIESRLHVKPETRNLQSRSTSVQNEDLQLESSEQAGESECMLGNETQGEEGHAHQTLLTNQRLQLLSSCEHFINKVSGWVQQGSRVLSSISEAGRQLCEAEEALNKHLQLNRQAESAGQDAENLKQILDQIRALQTSRQLSPLKALTEQLKRGGTGGNRTRSGTSTAQLGPPAADPPSPELAARVDRVLNELQSLNRRIDSNIQLLKPFVSFLRMAQQVEEEMQEQMEVYRRRPEEEIAGSSSSPLRKKKKKQVDTWQETLQRFLTCQELGNSYNQNITNQVSEATLNLEAMQSAVHQVLERLNKIKQEVNKLQSQQLIQIQQQQESCRKYQERLNKTLQDLNCVSEMLDSCTLMDLGSDLQTSKLLERFSQARPHFTNLDAEVEFIVKSWETLRGVQDRLEEEELKGGVVKEENLSELLQLQDRVKNKILQSESILDLTSSFHLAAKQLEALLQSEPISPSTGPAGSCGSSESEQQIQSLFNTASRLKTEICAAVQHCGGTSFRAEQLEARLLSLDALRVSWLNEAARREEKLRRERLVRLLNDDINQLRDSFKELKKRFNNLRFNYLKRNDRTRNMKAVRNQLQQVELYEEKLQALRKRLQGVTARLGSEVKDGGVAREVEDAVNELQRQMGEFERSVCEHQKTLDMTCKLQQAMEEYQFWCEDASATITRVGKFSSECRSTEAVAVLYRQFEKFVWPTVPQQEERISQITELAVRLHGVEEGQRYIEKTVSKHSEMVESIRELSDGLIKLEAKLKLENLKQQQDDREKEMKEEKDTEEKDEVEDEEKDKEEEEVKKKEKRKMMRKEQRDNRSTQEASDMYELKETGHTPELTTKHDGKEVPIKRQTAANRKPPLQKSRSLDSDRQTESRLQHTSSYCSTHTFSLSCSPADTNRRVHAIHSQSQPAEPQATLPPCVIGHSFSDIQREFQRKEMQDVDAELHQQEVMTEDSLSNDEYDCVSPDDISLPPMAETPESNMFQSDIEEGFCFSSHSVHQYSHQSEHSGAGTATGAVRQQRGCSQTESCPTPPTSRHSSSRHRSDSSSCVQSSLTVPVQSLVTSTLSGVLKVEKTSKAIPPPSADISLSHPEPSFPSESNPVHKSNTADSCSNKDNDVQKSLSHSQSQPLLKEFKSQYNQPHVSLNTKGKNTQCAASKGETFPQTDPSPKVAEFSHSTTFPQSSSYRQPFIAADPNLYKEKTLPQDTGNHDNSTTIPKTTVSTCQDFENVHHQDMNCHQTMKESSLDSKSPKKSLSSTCTSTSKVTHKTIYFQSPPLDSHQTLPQVSSSLSSQQEIPLSQTETLPQINPVSQAKGLPQSTGIPDPVVHENRTRDTGFFKSSATLLQTTITLPQEGNFSQSYLDARNGLDQDVPSSKNSKDTPSVSVSTSNSLITAATVTQQFYCQSSPSYSQSNVPQAISNLGSQEESSHSQDSGLPEVNAPNPQEPNSFSSINISSSTITNSNRISSHQSHHQTVYSLHESLTSICTQQCMHDPGMTPSSPAKPAAPPQPEPQPQALAQQANPHVILLSSSPHLLTPDQDPNICQPVAIREEIKLTPQIQGPPLPAPPPLPQAQAESLPKGKDSKPGPPCITRPLSRATVMEGSPVTLEVEVTEHPEPKLNWCKDGAVSASGPGQALLSCQDGNHFLFNHEAPDSDGGLYEAQAGKHHNSSGDKWLVSEVFDIISVDWQTWFGTLCVLLWLIYLIIL